MIGIDDQPAVLPAKESVVREPPYRRLRLTAVDRLECAYPDGERPYLLHQFVRKPWLEPMYHGVYSRLLRRLLVGPDLAVRVPADAVPARWRSGLPASLRRMAASVRDAPRWHLADTVIDAVPETFKDRLDALRHRDANLQRR